MVAWILATFLVCFMGNSFGESKDPTLSCPTYLHEGEDLDCKCHPTSPDSSCKTYWRGHPDGPRLQKPNVTRKDNGMRFTCETNCSGQKSSTDYTLQMAYGPSEGSVSVQGPTSFLADGNQTLTLTCVPGDVNPAPSFKWTNKAGLQCVNGDTEKTCVLRPYHFHDGASITCRVTNEETVTYVTADFTFNLTYPPPMTPELSGYIKGTPLKSGDTLECKVKGGNPLVSTVYLTCSDQAFPCQSITTGDSRVTSCQLDFMQDKRDTEEIQCRCSAVWEPDPELYVHVATDTIKVEIPPTAGKHGFQGEQTGAGMAAGTRSIGLIIGVILAGLLVIAIPIVVLVVFWRRNRRRKVSHNDMEYNQPLTSSKVDSLSPGSSIEGNGNSNFKTQPEDLKTDSGYSSTRSSTEDGYCLSEEIGRDVEEPARMSGDYSTITDEIKVAVKTLVMVSAHDTSNGYTEVQLDTPAGPELPVPTVNPHDVVDISQLDLPKPEVCLPTSHFASFRISQATPKYRGPLGDQYTLVDKKKGRCLPMVHVDNNGELDDTVEPNHTCNTEPDKMKNLQAENYDDGTYEKIQHGSKPTPHLQKPEQVYGHIGHHHNLANIVVC